MTSHRSDWVDGPMVGFDIESTGVDVHRDRIVTGSIVYVAPNRRPEFHNWLVNPGVPIPEEAQRVHGVSTEHAEKYGSPPASALAEINGHLAFALHRGLPVVAMNATFDLSILEAENHRHQVDTLASRLEHSIRPILDPLVIDRGVDRYRKGKRNLEALCRHYGLLVTGTHESGDDALMAVRIVNTMARQLDTVGDRPLVDLHDAQKHWHREWAQSFSSYLRKRGSKHADEVSTEWPVRPVGEVATA